MKTMESSSWNKKWRLKEGNIVNDNKESSLNPTTKNNLNNDLEVAESPTQKNPQNLIRYRRSNGDNNQPPSTFVPVDVPGDGSCLFWATTLAYLIPVEDDSAVFAERFKRLFGEEESRNIKYIRELIKEYDPFSNNIRSDRTFNRLVTRVLRNRVVDYISSDADRYREFITGDFNQYLNNIRDRNSWGGEPEIEAMGRMLGATINVDADGVVHTRGSGNIPIKLYHVNAARSASQGNEGNHYNFGLERNLHQHITNEVVPELVDHLFQIDENNNFKQRFQSFLDQIPRPSGVGAAPAKKGFYVNFFAGMFTTLKNTELFDRLGLAELHFKLCTISDADEVPFLKIVAITEEPTTKKLEEYVFVISEKRYSRQIMGAIFSRDDRRWLEESSLLFSEGDDRYHLRSRAHTKADEIEFKSGAAIIISKRNNRDRINVRAEQLTDQELPEGMRVKFRRIEQHRKHKTGEYKSNLLEDIVKNLSKETINDPRRDIDIVQAVQSNVKKLFEYIYDINGIYHKRLPNIPGALEAADHGFTAGALINFKYRYNLELYLELLLGIEGYIDIALLVRGSQRVKKAMPILVEIKTGQEQNGRTNPQQALREAESYTQGLQQNNRPFVTLADRVVRVGFNMDYVNPIAMSVAELRPPAPIIRTIFESVNSDDAIGQERLDDIKTSITNQLKKIYNLSPAIQGVSEPQYLSRLFIGHSILNSIENDETRIDKHVLTYRKLQETTRGTRRSHDITTSIFTERTIAGSDTGDNRVLVIHFHEGGRGDVDINDPTLRVPLNGIINQANCKEVIEVYVDARSGNDGSLKFLTEDNGVIIQDFTNSVNDYFQANVANHWDAHNMPDFNQADNLKKALDATMSYQPKKGQNNKVDLGPYSDMFTNIGKNLFSVKSLITSEAYFAAVLSGLLNSYSDIEFDQGDFKINVRPEFQVGGGERIDLFINVMSKNPADSDVLIGLELKYGDGRATVDSMDRTLEKAEKVQLRRYGISRNIRAITEGANFFVTLPVGFVSRAEAPDSLVITREQFVAYDIERSFLGQVHQLGRSVQRNEQTLESVTLQQNPDYRYWLSDQDIRRIANLDNTYSNMFDVHAMNNNYDTSGRGLVVVTDRYQGINTGELREQIRQFIDNVANNRIVQQQGVPTRTFIVNQGGDHWTTLVISQQNGQYHGYYVDSLGSGIPDNIRQILTDNNIINPIDFQIRQQADGYNCGLWVLENARDINTMLQENRDVQWLRAQLAPERLSRNSEQYFIDKRKGFSQVLHDNQAQIDSSQSRSTDSTSDSQVSSSQCLHGSRGKRSVNGCLYSWEDVDKFNAAEQQNRRNIDEIKIDSKKFLEYSKNIQDENKNAQLLELAKERIIASDNSIVGKYKYLLHDLIQDGGYNSYLQNDRIKYLASDFSRSDARKINPKLKQRLLNAAGRIQLIRGIHSTIATCQDGSEGYCALSVSGLGYSFLSQPIESVMVKITPKIVSKAASTVGKLAPRVLGYNTKFVIQIGGMKYGIKMARGAAGALAGAFDIIDIAISSNALVQCADRKDSNNPCSDKEIRDNIASIVFSGVSFIAGIGLTVAGAPLAATGVGLVLIGGYAIYSGVSNIIEYEKKYDTTHGENWSIFWRTILFQDMAQDIQHLAVRTEMVNNIAKEAWKNLEAAPDNMVFYAFGLGKVKFDKTVNCVIVERYLIGLEGDISPIPIRVKECRTDITSSLHPSYSVIDMHEKNANNTEHLSRVLPHPIQNATMICLPKITNADYEKGIQKSVSTAIHYCDNAIVMVHDQKKSSKNSDQWGIYDLRYVNTGTVIGSRELHNIFLLSDGNTEILGGDNIINKFVLTSDKFLGQISLGNNSTNIIDTTNLNSTYTSMRYYYQITKYFYVIRGISYPLRALTVYININDNNRNNTIPIIYDNHPSMIKLKYIGRIGKIDKIVCNHKPSMVDKSHNNFIVDSGGGKDYNNQDIIIDCKKVIISPHTIFQGHNGTYNIYIKSQNNISRNATSEINIVDGKGIISFHELSLLKDCDQITYSPVNNTMSFRIPLNQNGTFTLDVKNYLDRNNNTNFALIDKYGSNIIPKLDNNSTVVNRFELHARHSLNNFNLAKDYYREIAHTEKDYQVFGVISGASENEGEEFYKMFIGSSGTDVINLDQQTVFAEGGEGQDVYIASNTSGEITITIDNRSEDRKFDILIVQSIDDVSLEQEGDDLSVFIEKEVNDTTKEGNIVIKNYFLGNEYKHLILVDKNRNSFVPFELNENVILVPFYRASSGENVFTLPVSVKQAVIDNNLEDIEFYRDSNDLLLLEKDTGENPSPLAVILKDFYSNLSKWKNHKIYSCNHNGDYDNYIDLLQKSREAIDYKTYKYESVVKEYVVDFSKSIEIYHNQNGDEEKIGVMILRNIYPKQIEVYRKGSDLVFNDKNSNHNSNHTVSMKNWYISNSYKISTLEFDLGLNSIKIHKLDRDDSSHPDYLKSKISYATLSSNKIFLLGADVEHNLRCVVSTSSLNIPEAYIVLGFTSFQDQVNFLQNCDLRGFKLTELKNRINDLLSEYKNKLLYDLELSSHEHKKIDYYKHLIQDQLNSTDQIIQIMKDIHNPVKDFQNENGTYNITISQVEDSTTIDFRPLSQQIKKSPYQELQSEIVKSGNDILMKLFHNKDGVRVSPLLYSFYLLTTGKRYLFPPDKNYIIKLKEALSQDWYKKLHILLNDNTTMGISYNSSIGVSLVPVSEYPHSYRKVIVVTESGIEWKVKLANEETLQGNTSSKIGNTTTFRRTSQADYQDDDVGYVSDRSGAASITALSHVVSQQLEQLDSKIVNGIRYLLSSIGIRNNVKTYQCLGFDSSADQREFINTYSGNIYYLKQILQYDQAVEALMWLVVQSYSDSLLSNPYNEGSELLTEIIPCFESIIDKKIIHRLARHLEKEDIVFQVERFIKHHQQAVKDRMQEKVQNYLDNDYLNVEEQGLVKTIDNSDIYQRSRREVYMENNQEQSLFSYKNNDHAHPMSSSVSRLEFWPVNLVKSTWSIVIDAVNYLSSNSFEKGAQSLSNTNDTTKLGNSFKPYPSNMGNNTRSQHNSNSHEYATPPSSTKNQDVYCVPYSWDIESKKYVRDTMSCTSLSGQTKVFSNIHQSSNFVQDKDYSIGGDSYKNCRPVEFYGRPSVYCKGNHTNLIYAPNIQPRLFDSLDSNLMLGSVILHQVRKFYQWYQPTVEEETRYHLIVEITDQQLDDWNAQINKIKELLQYLKPSVSSKELQWAEYALIDHQEAISKLSSLSTASTEMIEILNENLQALLEDLAESKEESQDEIEKNINPIHHQQVKQNNSMNVNNNDQDSDDIISTIKYNNLKMLKAYLEAGKDANTFSRGGMTLLMRAVSNNCSTDLVKLLIEYGADVNTEDNDRETAINIASYNGNLELIKVLISGGAIIKNKTAKNSPFNSVAESSMPQNIKDEIIKLLSNNLSSVDSSNNKLNKDNYVISNLVEQMSAMNSSSGNVGFSIAESTNIVPPYLGQNPNYHNEVIKVFA